MNEREFRILRAIVNELRILNGQIRSSHQQQQAQDAENAQQPIRPLQVEVQMEAVTQDAIREHYRSENSERNSWWGGNKRWIETAGVVAAFVVAVFTVVTAVEIRKQTPAVIDSANAARSAAVTAATALEIAQRAYLSVGVPTSPLSKFAVIDIPLENYGHVPSKWFKLTLDYRRSQSPIDTEVKPAVGSRTFHIAAKDVKVLYENTTIITESKTIAPGPAGYHISITMPPLAVPDVVAINTWHQLLDIRGTIEYDIGFGSKTDSTLFCASYDHVSEEWKGCGGGVTDIQLKEDSASQSQKQQ